MKMSCKKDFDTTVTKTGGAPARGGSEWMRPEGIDGLTVISKASPRPAGPGPIEP